MSVARYDTYFLTTSEAAGVATAAVVSFLAQQQAPFSSLVHCVFVAATGFLAGLPGGPSLAATV